MPELTAVAADDYLEIVDTSTNTNKKISRETLTKFAWQDWTPTVTWFGGTTDPTSSTLAYAKYVVIGKMVTINVVCTVVIGSGNRIYAQFTLPINSVVNGLCGSGVEDLTTALRTPCNVSNYAFNSVVVYLPSAMARDGSMRFTFTYEIA